MRTLLFGRNFAKFEDLGVVHVGDKVLRFFAELVDLLRLAQVLKEGFFMLVVLELLGQPLDFVLACCILLLDCRKRYCRLLCGPRCCYRCHRNFSNRSTVPKMILRLGFVDLADHIASPMDLSEPSGRAHPEFSYISLSQCKLQAVCCRERLHVTVSDKIADLSLERASHCTNVPYFEGVSKYSCMVRSLVSEDRMEFLPCRIRPPSGSL